MQEALGTFEILLERECFSGNEFWSVSGCFHLVSSIL
jgi:hypothetical protein